MRDLGLVGVLLLCLVSRAWAITFSQQAGKVATSGTTFTVGPLTLGTNDFVVAQVFNAGSATETQTLSDNNGGVWKELTGFPVTDTTLGTNIDLWYAAKHTSGATTFTVTVSSTIPALGVGAAISTYTGVDTPDVKVTAAHNTNANPHNTGTINTNQAAEVLVGLTTAWQAGGTLSSVTDNGTSGGTVNTLTAVSGTLSTPLFPAYQIVAATGNYGFSFTLSAAAEGQSMMAGFYAAPAGAIGSVVVGQ